MALEKKYIALVVPENFSGRLDTFLQGSLPEKLSLSRSKVKGLILSGNVGQGDKCVKDPSRKVKSMEDQIENERNLNIIYLKEREELLDKKSKELSEIDREKDDNIKNLSNNEEKLDKILQDDYNLEKGE